MFSIFFKRTVQLDFRYFYVENQFLTYIFLRLNVYKKKHSFSTFKSPEILKNLAVGRHIVLTGFPIRLTCLPIGFPSQPTLHYRDTFGSLEKVTSEALTV